MRNSRRELEAGLKALSAAYPGKLPKVYPSVTNFVLAACPEAEAAAAFLAGRGIAVRKFPGYLRISGGTASENRELLDGLSVWLGEERG